MKMPHRKWPLLRNFYTTGKTSFFVDILTLDAPCKLAFYIGYVGESSSQWQLVVFSMKIIFAIYWPLKSIRIEVSKFANYHDVLVMIFCSIVCIPTLISFGISEDKSCNAISRGLTWNLLMALNTMQKYGYSTILILILTLIIAYKLFQIRFTGIAATQARLEKRVLSRFSNQRGKGGHSVQKFRVDIAIALVFQTILHTVIYLSCAVIWTSNYLRIYDRFYWNNIIHSIANLFDQFTVIVRIWNFYIYFARIQEFRHALFALVQCRIPRKSRILMEQGLAHLAEENLNQIEIIGENLNDLDEKLENIAAL